MFSRLFVALQIGVAGFYCFGAATLAQPVTAGIQQGGCPGESPALRARIDRSMSQAMNLANHGRMPEAIRLAEQVWSETHDPAVGFAVVQMLEQHVSSLLPACTLESSQRAANIARELMDCTGLPEPMHRQLPATIYRESVALAGSGQSGIAIQILNESFDAGFSGFETAMHEKAFQQQGLSEKLESAVQQARVRAIGRMTAESRAELAAFTSFPFTLDTVDIEARDFSLQSLQGRVVVVDFWGTWCPLCRQQTQSLVQLQKEFPDDLTVIGLAFENGLPEIASATVRESMLDNDINYRCVLGDPSIQGKVPGFTGFPTSVFLDRSGKVRMAIAGENPYEKYLSIVRLLIEEPKL